MSYATSYAKLLEQVICGQMMSSRETPGQDMMYCRESDIINAYNYKYKSFFTIHNHLKINNFKAGKFNLENNIEWKEAFNNMHLASNISNYPRS